MSDSPSDDWPSYAYVPGKFPHPIRDPLGHSHGVAEPVAAWTDTGQWRECRCYLRGIELFNAGYYWEAHESWEAVWHACGRTGVVADFCKALIKLAAAGVKARECRPNGVARHAQRAVELLQSVTDQLPNGSDRFLGLSFAELMLLAETLAAAPTDFLTDSNEPVVRVMPFEIAVVT